MAERDVLNPTPGWDARIQDSLCPDYGFTRKRPLSRAVKEAVSGPPYTREVLIKGHTFSLSWLRRSRACVEIIRQFYEQYSDGFFTLIDHDWDQRQYVGRFVGDFPSVEVGNGQWSIENLLFVEIPKVPMLKYPNDWQDSAVWKYVCDDYGDQKVAPSGTWALTARTFSAPAARSSLDSAGTNAGDWAQYEYCGYGFELYLLSGPAQGQADIYLDGTLLQTVDCYSPGILSPFRAIQKTDLSIDFHRVKAVVKNAKNAASTGTAVGWWALRVMR